MGSIVDDRGYNQGFVSTKAMEVRTRRRAQAILDEMDLAGRRKILELGCGTGELCYLLSSLVSSDVVGVDLCTDFIRTAQANFQRSNLKFMAMDLLQQDALRQFRGSFDYIVGNGVLHHLRPELPRILCQLRVLLAPGGRLIFWEPNLANPYVFVIFKFKAMRKLARLEPQEMAFTKRELARVFSESGFTDVRTSCRDFLLPNTPGLLIKPVIYVGQLIERIPALSLFAQSVFVSAG